MPSVKRLASPHLRLINLETAVEREKDAEGFGVRGEIKKFVVTFWVMRHFFILQGAPSACVDYCDSTAISRFNEA